jgi:hypothetical protein
MKKLFIIVCSLVVFLSCTKDRLFENQPINQNNLGDPTKTLLINEYLAKGSLFPDEFGVNSDWIELYNQSEVDIDLNNSEYFITDDFSKPDKFKISNKVIPAKGFIIIWCNSTTTQGTQLNAPFSLSASGEDLALYHKDVEGNFIALDSLSFGVQSLDNASNARIPDGSENWSLVTSPSPGLSNN